jgi:hypothetical protein
MDGRRTSRGLMHCLALSGLFAKALLLCGLALFLCGCGGRGLFGAAGAGGAVGAGEGAAGDGFVGPQQPGAELLSALPALPGGAGERPGRFVSKQHDNIQYGDEYWDKATPGADVSESRLVLYGPGGEYGAWGVYQWGGFTGGLVPDDVEVDIELPAGMEYWLLLSNYTTGRWEIRGPLTDELHSHVYDPHQSYVSPAANTYVGVLVDTRHTALLNKLNLRARRDIDPPAPPRGLRADNIMSHSADISWRPNPDQDVLGYRLYGGPDADFLPGDPGVALLAEVDYLTQDHDARGLESDTRYFYKLVAHDTAFNVSLPSDVLDFTTLPNLPPVPDFTWTPRFAQVGREVVFDPSATTDVGDDVSRELFEWDFDNDGSFDAQSTGPELVGHSYPARGPVSVRLRVSDPETSAQVIKDLIVSFRYDFHQVGKATGFPAVPGSLDTDPATSRIALVVSQNTSVIYYFHDGAWEYIDYPAAEDDYILDIALTPSSIAILTVSYEVISAPNDKTIHWAIKEFSGNMWQTRESGTHTDDTVAYAHLCRSQGGLYSFGMVSGIVPPPPLIEIDWWCHWYHGKTGGGWRVEDLDIGLDPPQFGIVRTGDTTSVVYALATVQLTAITDASVTTDVMQGYDGQPFDLSLQMDPDNAGQCSWLLATSSNRLFWGDNFGAPNGNDQFHTVPDRLMHTLGLRSLSDNEAEFYWIANDGSDRSLVAGYNSAANGGAGEVYDLGSGYGFASTGDGGQFSSPDGEGVYYAVHEERDGEILGHFMNQGTELAGETLYQPTGISPVLGQSSPVIFPDGSLKVLFQQPYPTALTADATGLDQNFTTDFCGVNNYLIPTSACATGNGGEFITATVSLGSDLVVNRFDGSTTGDEMFVTTGVRVAQARRNLTSDIVLIAYTQSGETELYSREWDGAAWGLPLLVATTAQPIVDIRLAARPDGGFGLAFEELDSKLSLAEKSGALWGPPAQISSEQLNDLSGIGLSYGPDGACACAVERFSGADKGVWLGQRASGAPGFIWQKVEATNGHQARSVNTLYGVNGALVFYYNAVWPDEGFGLRVLEKYGANWTGVLFDFPLYDVPIGSAVDPAGNIVMSGLFGVPSTAVYAVIWR